MMAVSPGQSAPRTASDRPESPPPRISRRTHGAAWRQAVDVARRSAPERVVELEKAWGDHLVAQRAPEAAVAHFIEARAHAKSVLEALEISPRDQSRAPTSCSAPAGCPSAFSR